MEQAEKEKLEKIKVPTNEIKTWVNALRSGDYSQTKKNLQTEKGYCCLGVACKVLINNPKTNSVGWLHGPLPSKSFQPNVPNWLEHVNKIVSLKLDSSLIEANDIEDYTFDEIADLLELVFIHKALD